MMTREQGVQWFAYGSIALIIAMAVGGGVYWAKTHQGRPPEEFGLNLDAATRKVLLDNINKYTQQTQANRSDGNAWLQLAINLEQLGDLSGAISAYEKSAQYSPNSFLPFESLGNLYVGLGRYDDAEVAYYTALKKDPIKAYLYRPLVELYDQHLTAKREKIPELLNAGLALPALNEFPELLGLLATYYKNHGDHGLAIQTYQRLVKADPKNDTAKEELRQLQQP